MKSTVYHRWIRTRSISHLLLGIILVILPSPTNAFVCPGWSEIGRRDVTTASSSSSLRPSTHSILSSRLFAESSGSNSNNNRDTNNKPKAKGVYVRPSGAIERGSGFFVPGLEGPRVRVLFGGIILLLTGLNHIFGLGAAGGGGTTTSFSLEEQIAIFYSILVLFQAAIEFRKDVLMMDMDSQTTTGSTSNSNNPVLRKEMIQKWNQGDQELSESDKEKIQWAAASFLSVTPATQMLLLSKDSILYRLGGNDDESISSSSSSSSSTIEQGVRAALEQLSRSKGGRVALPNSHPAVIALGLESARTVVLQRISEESCWVMSSSNQLLASFTSADLKWLGQMARYITV